MCGVCHSCTARQETLVRGVVTLRLARPVEQVSLPLARVSAQHVHDSRTLMMTRWCFAGKYSVAGSGATACTDCDAGKFSAAVGASVASTCADCEAGKYQLTAGVASVWVRVRARLSLSLSLSLSISLYIHTYIHTVTHTYIRMYVLASTTQTQVCLPSVTCEGDRHWWLTPMVCIQRVPVGALVVGSRICNYTMFLGTGNGISTNNPFPANKSVSKNNRLVSGHTLYT